ncbi:serine-rich adhesin for platelets isoform X2 [Clupea harengus]|uniref:Serine-rich adhesin for platelets isoform X2 n=1 Tax=Clupea harengus TaxID=7950 RepID=A0A8M1KJ45_CLUHA|nr:serine-rich adhesin for platelets isoform X2 [Clupea harengus]
MAGRRGCVNSLWSGSERVRIGERLKATLAGILELDLLRCRHLEMVDAALDKKQAIDETEQNEGTTESATEDDAATSRRQQSSLPKSVLPCPSIAGEEVTSRWSSLSWEIPSELLSPLSPDTTSTTLVDGDSRPSSGFYSVSGSSLSDSSFSVASEVALGGSVKAGGGPCRPLSADHSANQWREASQSSTQSAEEAPGEEERRPVSTGDLEIPGLVLLSDLCAKLGGSPQAPPLSDSCGSLHSRMQLDPKFCSDLVSRQTKEVYPYPSPLHAVALQSPIFTLSHDHSCPQLPPSPETEHSEPDAPTLRVQTSAPPSLTQLEMYISRLVHQYHTRTRHDSSSHSLYKSISVSSQDTFQSRTHLDNHGSASNLPGASVTPCKLGNLSRVRLSSISKKASRNSINLGNLPSVTGEDFNISFHLNLNLNLNPNLNKALDTKTPKEDMSASCGYLGASITTPTASPSSSTLSFTPTPTPTSRSRPRISTCPSQVNHRGSLEVTGKVFGPMGFSRSLDWSGASREEADGCPPLKTQDGSPKLSEDSEVVCEISRVSGLPCSVVVGLMEEGVELDTDCFRIERETGEGSASPSQPYLSQSPRLSCQTGTGSPSQPYLSQSPRLSCQTGTGSPSQPYLSQSPLLSCQTGTGSPSQPYLSQSARLSCQTSTASDLVKLHFNGQTTSHWIPSVVAEENGSQQHCLQIAHSDSHSARTSQSASPACSEHSGPTPTHRVQRMSPVLPVPPTPESSDPASPGSSSMSCHPRVHSPPRLLSGSPFTPAQLSVFRRDAPAQCSLPRFRAGNSAQEGGTLRPRGGSLRQEAGAGWRSHDRGWRRSGDGERLYQGKHASRELVRASTVSSYSSRDYSTCWDEEVSSQTPKKGTKFWQGFDGRFWGKDGHSDCGERDGRGSKRKDSNKKSKEQEVKQKQKGTQWEGRSSSLSSSRRMLFRSESQGILEPHSQQRKGRLRTNYWASSLEIAREGFTEQGRSIAGREDKHLSSTASLFHLSGSQSLEGSCQSLSPLSSPSYSPSPPPAAPLTRSKSFRDLGRRVFGSVRSLSLRGNKTKQ